MPIVKTESHFYNSSNSKKKAIILLHGFNSSKEEVGDFYLKLSSALEAKGIASYAPDLFIEKGKMLSLAKQYDMAKQAVQFLSEEDYEEIAICGFSLGSFLAMHVAKEFKFNNVVLLSPLFSLADDFTGFVGFNINAMLSDPSPYVLFDQKGVGKIEVPKDFINEVKNLYNNFTLDSGRILAISGDEDFSARNHKLIAAQQPTALTFASHILPKTDHIFNAFRPGEEKTNEVISLIRDFL